MQYKQSAASLSFSGLVALAIAMGIGRFAFTPLLPMMQNDAGLALTQGGWLASANYLGYLVGALAAGMLTYAPATLLRGGLLLVVVTTALMGLTDTWPSWLVWRFMAGVASACVLVGAASLCLSRLAVLGESQRAGQVFAGVGSGVILAGLLCMALDLASVRSAHAWLVLAVLSLLGMIAARPLWLAPTTTPAPTSDNHHEGISGAAYWKLVLCYGLFGFGYILPATFLPAQARMLIADPAVFGLAWPLFGVAAAVSTLLASRLFAAWERRKLWAACQIIMAAGVLLPVIWSGMGAIILAAICVGGTFMVITMLGMQEAQAVGGRHAKKLIASITAAFAAGQLIGPMFFSLSHAWFNADLNFALVLATVGLVLSSIWLLMPDHNVRSTQESDTSTSKIST
ncbi:YbfB/YjiJ family MFS transporter [Pollutimonas harenae]|uniref:YbfB/YjiJ family MFS transporter n=1 Tax=Pollutimonas harenae TaxID=657015 RepID=A0A853GSS7_9BURK|nr:YbfB/YjiJ family MFS transporter [Pollutimonas harenae]NYT86178.1 YbfB/YjiJ family MFS transporter [Pollutimonas harenae]TEA71213.1 YbfB/YjiJ family MFS transporter [Pollutimonas harenae]